MLTVGLAYTSKRDMSQVLTARGHAVGGDALEEYDAESTVGSIVQALEALPGCTVRELGWGENLIEGVRDGQVDIVFNIAEGFGGRNREAQVPAFLEMLGIPFVGSDSMALGLSLDKPSAKNLVRSAGVAVPRALLVREALGPDSAQVLRRKAGLDFPLVVKPACEGSSMGIRENSVVRSDAELAEQATRCVKSYAQPALVEEYVWGEEVTVGILGHPAVTLAAMSIQSTGPLLEGPPSRPWVYGLDEKRDFATKVSYDCPARLNSTKAFALHEAALRAFEVLGCHDVARVDFRIRPGGQPVFLEINPLPGLNPDSGDLVIMAKLCGWSHAKLVQSILISGLCRRGLQGRLRV